MPTYRATLASLIPFTEGSGNPGDLIRGAIPTLSGGSWTTNAFGPCVLLGASDSVVIGTDGTDLTLPTGPCTVLHIRRLTGAGNGYSLRSDAGDASSGAILTYVDGANIHWDYGNSGTKRTTATYTPTTVIERFAHSQGPAGGKTYRDGTLLVTGSEALRSGSTSAMRINSASGGSTVQEVNYFAILNEQMDDADVAAWAAAPDPVAYFDVAPATPAKLTQIEGTHWRGSWRGNYVEHR